jgi:cellulose biosynthesis protein BcsQ
MEKILRVSFYSYKGGAGRSTTSWNTIQRLVALMEPTAKEPFVIVDTDTESAGSTFLYEAEDDFSKDDGVIYQSVQKRIMDKTEKIFKNDSDKEKFFSGMKPVGKFFGLPGSKENAVLLIGANIDRKKNEFDSTGGSEGQAQIKNFNRNILAACRACGAKALFFDTPSGTQFLARKSIELSEIIVCCMRPTTQFRKGTKSQLINFIKQDYEAQYEKKYILTPTVICMDKDQVFEISGEEKPRVYPGHAKEEILREFETPLKDEKEEIRQAFKNNVLLDMLETTPASIKDKTKFDVEDDNELVFGIPEIKRFKWFEMYLAKIIEEGGELKANDKIAINRYEFLAQTILKHRKN